MPSVISAVNVVLHRPLYISPNDLNRNNRSISITPLVNPWAEQADYMDTPYAIQEGISRFYVKNPKYGIEGEPKGHLLDIPSHLEPDLMIQLQDLAASGDLPEHIVKGVTSSSANKKDYLLIPALIEATNENGSWSTVGVVAIQQVGLKRKINDLVAKGRFKGHKIEITSTGDGQLTKYDATWEGENEDLEMPDDIPVPHQAIGATRDDVREYIFNNLGLEIPAVAGDEWKAPTPEDES